MFFCGGFSDTATEMTHFEERSEDNWQFSRRKALSNFLQTLCIFTGDDSDGERSLTGAPDPTRTASINIYVTKTNTRGDNDDSYYSRLYPYQSLQPIVSDYHRLHYDTME